MCDSLDCIPPTYIILYINYMSIKKKFNHGSPCLSAPISTKPPRVVVKFVLSFGNNLPGKNNCF